MEDERNKNTLLNHLDQPVRFLIFTMPEFVVAAVPLFVGFYFESGILGVIGSALGIWGLRKFQKYTGGGSMRHFLYWHMPTHKTQQGICVPSFVREWGA